MTDTTETANESPRVIDVEALLAPIPGDAATGIDLRADGSPVSPYYLIKDARNAARAAERQLNADPDNPSIDPPDWRSVLAQAPDILTNQSKNLEIVAWYIEALLRVEGLPGLRDGLDVARGLCERYWDELYPLADEDEGELTRVAPLGGLNGEDAEGTLIQPMRDLLITRGMNAGPYNVWQYEQAQALEKVSDSDDRERKIAAGAVSMADFTRAVSETPLDFFRTLRADLEAAQESFRALSAVLDEKAGVHSPPTSNLRSAFEEFGDTLTFVTAGLVLNEEPESEESDDEDGEGAGDSGGGGGGGGSKGALKTREDAFRRLEEVAQYFRRTEPHSPLAYSLEQAVRWGRMPFPELLKELIRDDSERESIFRLTGVRSSDDDSGGY